MTITIPKTFAAAKKRLTGLGALLTATEWERAAIVAAFTEPRAGQGTNVPTGTKVHSPTTFAQLGIHGLSDRRTVQHYRAAWVDRYGSVVPGQTVALPNDRFPDNPRSPEGTIASFRSAVQKDPTVLQKVIRGTKDEDGSADPQVVDERVESMTDAIATGLAADPYIAAKVQTKVEAKQSTPQPKAPGQDWSKVVRAVRTNHGRADLAVRDLIRDLNPANVYAEDIQELIEHLEQDRDVWLPQTITNLRGLLGAAGHAPVERVEKNVTPVKELV